MSYSKLAWTAVIAAFAASIGAVPAAAKGGNAKAKQPTVRVTSAKAKPVKVAKAGPSAKAAAKAKAPTPKVKAASTSGATKAAKAKGSRTPTVSSNPALTTSDTNPAPTSVNPAPIGTLNKAQQLLMKNDNLRMKMQTRLGGMDPVLAASDFRNLGQFVAAVNASYNDPTIQFLALKALMTGDPPMSLGQAKRQLRSTPPPPTSIVPTVPATGDQR